MNDPYLYGLIFFLLLVLLILKSAFESVNQLQLELDKKKKNYHSRILNFISNQTFDFSVTINICYILVLVMLVHYLKTDLFDLLNSPNKYLYIFGYVLLFGLIILPGLIVLPKTLGEYFSSKTINFLAIPLVIVYIIFYPVTKIILILSRIPLKSFDSKHISETQKVDFDKEDLNKLVSESQKHSSSDNDIAADIKLFKNALEFSDVKLRECMIPRTEITAVDIEEIDNELKAKFISTGYSKILIFKDNIENIIGYVKSKSLFSTDHNIRQNIRKVSYFPESMHANKLLKHFIRTGQNIAVIVDEFGGTSGIITIEDILEEIFGEIQDEHDTDDLYEKRLSDYDFIFSGRIEIDYINEKYNLDIPENDEYETVAGFILYHTENLPGVNEKITINNFNFKILKVSETKVELVKLEINKLEP